jgi:peroxiredoxin Q/BCP
MKGLMVGLLLSAMIPMTVIAQEKIRVGDQLPEFKLPYATKDTVVFEGIGSKGLAGLTFVLAFYPADWSSGCTKEVCTFRDAIADFESLDVTVFGVSVDNPFSHRRWAQEEDLNFKLLSDQTHKFGKAIGVYSEEHGVFTRSTFVVGPDGKIKYVDYEYSVKDNQDFETLKKALAGK